MTRDLKFQDAAISKPRKNSTYSIPTHGHQNSRVMHFVVATAANDLFAFSPRLQMFCFATCIAISPTLLLCAVCADPWRGSAWFSLGGCILYNTALLSAWRKQQKSTPSLSICFMSKTTVVCVWKWGIQQKCSLPWWGIEWDMGVSENSVPSTQWLMIIIPIKWL